MLWNHETLVVRRRKCGPGLWTHLATTTNLILCSVSVIVPLSVVTCQNLASVAERFLDAPHRGSLGFLRHSFFAEIFFLSLAIYTSFLQSSRPEWALCRCSGCSSPLLQFGPTWTLPHTHTHANTHTYLHTYTQFLQISQGPHFSISTVYSLTKKNV